MTTLETSGSRTRAPIIIGETEDGVTLPRSNGQRQQLFPRLADLKPGQSFTVQNLSLATVRRTVSEWAESNGHDKGSYVAGHDSTNAIRVWRVS